MINLAEHDLNSLEALLAQMGHARSHAIRILRAYYDGGGTFDPRAVQPRLPRALCELLDSRASSTRVIDRSVSSDGTAKLLLALHDGATVESVLMSSHRPDRAAGCVSSQVGCAMGCDFCATTKSGFTRDLTSGEIVEQFLALRALAASQNRRLITLVFMGMGEPLLNYDAVVAAIRRIADSTIGSLGWRHVTVSTVGIVPGIDRFTHDNVGAHLALSLHAPDDETRRKLVPTARKWSIAEILDAARRYQQKTGRITTIEYCLLAGVNDSDEQALALANLVRDDRMHVNVIPYNTIGAGLTGVVYERPSDERIASFIERLRENRIVAHVRRTRGDSVDAACGQLRQRFVQLKSDVQTQRHEGAKARSSHEGNA